MGVDIGMSSISNLSNISTIYSLDQEKLDLDPPHLQPKEVMDQTNNLHLKLNIYIPLAFSDDNF